VDYVPGEGFGAMEVLVCERCGWRADGVPVEETEPPPPRTPEGQCITVKVPLRLPFKKA